MVVCVGERRKRIDIRLSYSLRWIMMYAKLSSSLFSSRIYITHVMGAPFHKKKIFSSLWWLLPSEFEFFWTKERKIFKLMMTKRKFLLYIPRKLEVEYWSWWFLGWFTRWFIASVILARGYSFLAL